MKKLEQKSIKFLFQLYTLRSYSQKLYDYKTYSHLRQAYFINNFSHVESLTIAALPTPATSVSFHILQLSIHHEVSNKIKVMIRQVWLTVSRDHSKCLPYWEHFMAHMEAEICEMLYSNCRSQALQLCNVVCSQLASLALCFIDCRAKFHFI